MPTLPAPVIAVAFSLSITLVASGDIVVPNGTFESAVTNTSDITSNTQVTTGTWHGTSSIALWGFDNGPSDSGSNVLRRADTGSGFAGNIREYSRYNFIDLAGESGDHQLAFDYKRFKGSGFISALGHISVDIFGLQDTGAAGWTTSTPFDTFFSTTTAINAQMQNPILVDATLTELGSFEFSGLDTNWRLGTIDFDLGSGTEYDQLVIRASTRHHLNARENHSFDNFTITAVAVPEPTSLVSVSCIAMTLILRRDRR